MADVNIQQACADLLVNGNLRVDNVLNYLEFLVDQKYLTARFNDYGDMYFIGWHRELVDSLCSPTKVRLYEKYRVNFYGTIKE